MAITTTCKGCGLEFTGKDEDDLVTQLQAHIEAGHAAGHSPSREQVLAVIRARHAEGVSRLPGAPLRLTRVSFAAY